MSEKGGITHDTAARLIGVSPADLDAMVRNAIILREDKNRYTVPALVQGYVSHLRSVIDEKEAHPKQADTAIHLDLSDRSIREWETKLGFVAKKYSLSEFRISYIRALREEAAGRATAGDSCLATERARLARAQAEKIEMQNAVSRKELAPVALLEQVLATTGTKAQRILATIKGELRRRFPALNAADLQAVDQIVGKALGQVAAMSLTVIEDGDQESPDDDTSAPDADAEAA